MALRYVGSTTRHGTTAPLLSAVQPGLALPMAYYCCLCPSVCMYVCVYAQCRYRHVVVPTLGIYLGTYQIHGFVATYHENTWHDNGTGSRGPI